MADNIRRGTGSDHEDIVEFLQDAEEKMVLYMRHQHHCYNQERRISDIFGELREDVSLSKAVVLLDYKMNLSLYVTEKRQLNFWQERHCVSWGGDILLSCGLKS